MVEGGVQAEFLGQAVLRDAQEDMSDERVQEDLEGLTDEEPGGMRIKSLLALFTLVSLRMEAMVVISAGFDELGGTLAVRASDHKG